MELYQLGHTQKNKVIHGIIPTGTHKKVELKSGSHTMHFCVNFFIFSQHTYDIKYIQITYPCGW